jgi:hypothetical protein
MADSLPLYAVAGSLTMKPIPKSLQYIYARCSSGTDTWGWDSALVKKLIERIARLEAKKASR